MLFRQDRQRDIRAHGRGRLRAGLGHGQNGVLNVVIRIPEDLVQPAALQLCIFLHLPVRDRDIRQLQKLLIEPFAVGVLRGIAVLDLVVLQNGTGRRVDQQHLPRLQPGFADDLLRADRQHTHLGGQNQIAVGGHKIPRRPQPVAVKHGADDLAVGKQNGGRAVPRLHHGRIIVEHIPLFPGHVFIPAPRLRNAQHDGLRQRDPAVRQKFQRVVQHGGI